MVAFFFADAFLLVLRHDLFTSLLREQKKLRRKKPERWLVHVQVEGSKEMRSALLFTKIKDVSRCDGHYSQWFSEITLQKGKPFLEPKDPVPIGQRGREEPLWVEEVNTSSKRPRISQCFSLSDLSGGYHRVDVSMSSD